MTGGVAGLIAAATGPARLRRDLVARVAPARDLLRRADELPAIASRLPDNLTNTAMMNLYSAQLLAALASSPKAPPPLAAKRARAFGGEAPWSGPVGRDPSSAPQRRTRQRGGMADAAGGAATPLTGPIDRPPPTGAAPIGTVARGLERQTGRLLADLEAETRKPSRPAADSVLARAARPASGAGLLVSRLTAALAGAPAAGAADAVPAAGFAPATRQGTKGLPLPQAAFPEPEAQPPAPFPAAGPLGARRGRFGDAFRPLSAPARSWNISDSGSAGGGRLSFPERSRSQGVSDLGLPERIADILREQAARQGIDLT